MEEKQWPDWLVDYPFDGVSFSILVRARTADEARARINAIGNHGVVMGELMATIPATPGSGWFARAFCWWKNR